MADCEYEFALVLNIAIWSCQRHIVSRHAPISSSPKYEWILWDSVKCSSISLYFHLYKQHSSVSFDCFCEENSSSETGHRLMITHPSQSQHSSSRPNKRAMKWDQRDGLNTLFTCLTCSVIYLPMQIQLMWSYHFTIRHFL